MNPSIQFILKFQSIVGIIYCIICLNFDFKKNEILRSVFIFFQNGRNEQGKYTGHNQQVIIFEIFDFNKF